MKKMYKKIILVILVLMISAVSVYAWAYINNRVDINGVQVKPSGTEGLYIAKSGSSSFSATVTASSTNAQMLNSVSTADLKDWYIPANEGSITEGGKYDSAFELIDNAEASHYYYSESFDIKATETTEGLSELKITAINVTNSEGEAPNKDISKALRVGIKTNTNKMYIFAPVEGYSDCDVVGADGYTVAQSLKNVPSTILNTVQAGTTYTVTVFVWYEGQDDNYTMVNLYDPEDLIIDIEFTVPVD